MASKFPSEIDTLIRNSLGEAIVAVQTKVGVDGDAAGASSVEGRLKSLEAGGGSGVPTSRQVATAGSLTGGGDLTVDRILQLDGDASTPGANMVYGTDSGGTKGWKADPTGGSGLTQSQVLARGLGS